MLNVEHVAKESHPRSWTASSFLVIGAGDSDFFPTSVQPSMYSASSLVVSRTVLPLPSPHSSAKRPRSSFFMKMHSPCADPQKHFAAGPSSAHEEKQIAAHRGPRAAPASRDRPGRCSPCADPSGAPYAHTRTVRGSVITAAAVGSRRPRRRPAPRCDTLRTDQQQSAARRCLHDLNRHEPRRCARARETADGLVRDSEEAADRLPALALPAQQRRRACDPLLQARRVRFPRPRSRRARAARSLRISLFPMAFCLLRKRPDSRRCPREGQDGLRRGDTEVRPQQTAFGPSDDRFAYV
jgi:hypothetical protein